jgi:hypothetical protein
MAQRGNKEVWAFVKKLYRGAKKLWEFWLVVAFYGTMVGSPFCKPELEVKYRLDRLYPPIAAEKYVLNAPKESKVDNDAIGSLSRLVSSRELLHLSIRNNSTDRIEDVDLQIDGCKVSDVAIHSNSSKIMAERDQLTTFEISDNLVIRFPNLTTIPPKAVITMIVWGDFKAFLLRAPVRVFSTAKAVTVVQEGTTSGLRLFVATYLSWFVALLAVGLLLLGLRRFS